MDKNLNETSLSKQKTMLFYLIYNFYNKYINIFNNDKNEAEYDSDESSCIDYEYTTKLSEKTDNILEETDNILEETDNISESSEDTNIFDIFFKSKETHIETYLKNDNKIYNDITTQIQDIDISSEELSNNKSDSEFISKNSDNSTVTKNDIIESIQWNLETLNKKIDKVVNNKKLIEFTEVINDPSLSETEKQIDTIQLWNKIEKKNSKIISNKNNKKSNIIYSDSPENNTSILESYMYNNKKNNIFISCNDKEKSISEKTTSSISDISENRGVVDKYIIKENSENEKDLIEFYFPRYKNDQNNNYTESSVFINRKILLRR